MSKQREVGPSGTLEEIAELERQMMNGACTDDNAARMLAKILITSQDNWIFKKALDAAIRLAEANAQGADLLVSMLYTATHFGPNHNRLDALTKALETIAKFNNEIAAIAQWALDEIAQSKITGSSSATSEPSSVDTIEPTTDSTNAIATNAESFFQPLKTTIRETMTPQMERLTQTLSEITGSSSAISSEPSSVDTIEPTTDSTNEEEFFSASEDNDPKNNDTETFTFNSEEESSNNSYKTAAPIESHQVEVSVEVVQQGTDGLDESDPLAVHQSIETMVNTALANNDGLAPQFADKEAFVINTITYSAREEASNIPEENLPVFIANFGSTDTRGGSNFAFPMLGGNYDLLGEIASNYIENNGITVNS